MKTKVKKQIERKPKETSLEVRAGEVIAKGGVLITRDDRQITLYNCPRSYSDAVRSGLNFYFNEKA